jgi:hypothetical protein
MTAQEIACQQAFASGDKAYFNAAGCTQSVENTALIEQAKKSLDTKTYLLIGGGVIATGILIYLSTRT